MKHPKVENMEGLSFGKWKVLNEVPERKEKKPRYYLCRCQCGEERVLNKYRLTSGSTSSCVRCSQRLDLKGQKFGKLLVLGTSKKRDSKNGSLWECQCECGKILHITSSQLTNGSRTRCRGCTYEDLTGQRFGNQTVLNRCHKTRKWNVLCDCGVHKLKSSDVIKVTKSCGRCENRARVGKKFGNLLVLSIPRYNKDNQAIFEVQCDCGNKKEVSAISVTSGQVRSCGCLRDKMFIESASKLIGLRFGSLTIKKILGYKEGTKRIVFLCRCKCGNLKKIERSKICDINSCGCSLKEKSTRGENHPHAKIKNWEATSIRELASSGLYSQREIAKIFSVHETLVSKVILRKTYNQE